MGRRPSMTEPEESIPAPAKRRAGLTATAALPAMYMRFFGLKQQPFSLAPDPRYLYMSKRHREALAHLLYGVGGGGGFVLLSGEIGAGKTTVCRCFLEQIPKRCNVAYIFNPKLTVMELLKIGLRRVPHPGAVGRRSAGADGQDLRRRRSTTSFWRRTPSARTTS